MREIGEIHIETKTDPYTEGPSTKRCRAVVRDPEGTHLAHIDFTVENTPVPIIHMKNEANRRPSHVLGSLIRAADRIVIDELNPTVLNVASDFIDVPWEKVVVAGSSAELEYKAVAVADRLFLTHPEWEGEGITLAQTGEYVEISDRLAGKLAYQSPNNLISGRASVRLPVHTGETLADDMSLLDEARCHRCVGLTEHLAVPRADMVPATFGELDARGSREGPRGLSSTLGGHRGGDTRTPTDRGTRPRPRWSGGRPDMPHPRRPPALPSSNGRSRGVLRMDRREGGGSHI